VEIIGVQIQVENVKIKNIVNVYLDLVVLIVVVVCYYKKKQNFIILLLLLYIVKCSKGTSTGLICFNGGICNNESDTCNCRPGYQDGGSGCLIS